MHHFDAPHSVGPCILPCWVGVSGMFIKYLSEKTNAKNEKP